MKCPFTLIHYAGASIICALLSVGCAKRVQLNAPTPTVAESEVSVSFVAHIGTPSASVRAMGGIDDELNKNIGRLNLKNIRVVFYHTDEAGEPTVVAQNIDWSTQIFRGKVEGVDPVRLDSSTLSVFLDGQESLKVDDYLVLLFTSPSSTLLSATEVGMPYGELLKEQQYLYHQKSEKNTANLAFNTYSNINNPTRITKEHLLKYQSMGKPFPINISNLEPANAYIYIKWSNTLGFPGYSSSKERQSYAIVYFDAQNRKYYLSPKYIESEYDLPSGGVMGQFRVPQDPNYAILPDADQDLLDSHYIYLTQPRGSVYSYASVEHLSGGYDVVLPVAENTLSSDHVTGKVATRAAIGIPLVPDQLKQESTALSRHKNSFYVFNGEAYTVDQLSSLHRSAKSSTTPSPDQILLMEEVKRLNVALGLEAEGGVPSDLTILDRGYDGGALSFYYKGLAYYLLVFRPGRSDNITSIDKPGRFGIIRNQLYNIHITKLSHLGAADPEGLFSDRETDYNQNGTYEVGFRLPSTTIVTIDKEF